MLVVFEDEHLLVANKPPGWNTHAPSLFAGEGLYEWLKNSEPSRATLAILHRLDKETSGLIVFGKTTPANQSLAAQFERHEVRKKYVLLTDRPLSFSNLAVKSALARSGQRYLSRPAVGPGSQAAQTLFYKTDAAPADGLSCLEAQPLSGKTHQIRVHAADSGFPILGDRLYGGSVAPRLFLHAAELHFRHPLSRQWLSFQSPPDFFKDSRLALRTAIIDDKQTDCWRVTHGAPDGWPGLYIDRLGEVLLAQSEAALSGAEWEFLEKCHRHFSARAIYHKLLRIQPHCGDARQAGPRLLAGAQGQTVVKENGMQFQLRFDEGYSPGLFLDQRQNRRRLLTDYVAAEFFLGRPKKVLNAFAYTCAFSVCAAARGAAVTSIDLSRKYLQWGKENFIRNGLDPAGHEFLFGDAIQWMQRLAKKNRSFDLILLDPPTFSRSKQRGVFQVEKHYRLLVQAALPLLRPQGVLFASTNCAAFQPQEFLTALRAAIAASARPILRQHYAPQPPDFPISRDEPAYLKTIWLQIG